MKSYSILCNESLKLGYKVYLPDNDSNNRLPLIVFLHGAGERGNGVEDLEKLALAGIPKYISEGKSYLALASYICADGSEDAVIVTDSVTSDGLKEYIENTLHCKHYRYRRGYKNVINKAIEFTSQGIECPLAIETSGHAAFKENFFLDDGAYLVTKVVIELAKGKDINEILKPLKIPIEEKEIRIDINTEDFKTYGNDVLIELEKFVSNTPEYTIANDNREGVRVSTHNGWFLLRLSVHDPIMVLNIESNEAYGIDKMLSVVNEFIKNFPLLSIN